MKEVKEHAFKMKYKKMKELSLYNAGIESCVSSKKCGPFIRPFNVIHFVISGRGTVNINGKEYVIYPGDSFIIPSDTLSYYQADISNPWSYAWIGYIGIDSYKYSTEIIEYNQNSYLIKDLDTAFYYKVVTDIVKQDLFSSNNHFKASSILYSMMDDLYVKLKIDNIEKSSNSLAERIRNFIDINYTENLQISFIAKRFNIHVNYLSKIFSLKYGISPKSYLIKKKIDKACELLVSSDYSITTISNSLGYDDVLTFSKIFKHKKGLSPYNYKKKMLLEMKGNN